MEVNEIIGYAASSIIIISFLFKDMQRLRLVNSIGCLLFIVYGIGLDYNIPLILPNAFILGLNIYHLFLREYIKNKRIY